MGIRPWRRDLSPELLGAIMSSYYGGRSGVHLRRIITRVLYCDFLSMYPTVCTLMRLWRYVVAEDLAWTDATAQVQEFLDRVTLSDIQKPDTWLELCMLVQVEPDCDSFPVRAKYESGQYTIGLNFLTAKKQLWFTLADCIASKLLTGKVPKVLKALRFDASSVQTDLQAINIAGNPRYHVNPSQDNFYKRLIDLRQEVKAELKAAKEAGDKGRAAFLDAEQLTLKISGNATSYGIFAELNVNERGATRELMCYGADREPFTTKLDKEEEPGSYFHPLLAALITGAARLMLALAERLAEDAGIAWAFCDTDSMALAKPDGMDEQEFLAAAQSVIDWFTGLNPYECPGPIFKIEDANYQIVDGHITSELIPLYCLPISAKRYVLFNLGDDGQPAIRKASAHGLGHLRPPYEEDNAPPSIPAPVVKLTDIGVNRWEHDVWYRIIQATLEGHPEQLRLDDLPNFGTPALSRYAATTPRLLDWFRHHNKVKPYREQVRPFGFLLAAQAKIRALSQDQGGTVVNRQPESAQRVRRHTDEAADLPRAVAPYDADPQVAVQRVFDRRTGTAVAVDRLKTYQQSLAQYHLHSEDKFHNGTSTDSGPTTRRHIVAAELIHIGKEANRWDEQVQLGADPEAQIEYGVSPADRERSLDMIAQIAESSGQRTLANAARVSVREIAAVKRRERRPGRATLAKLRHAVPELEAAHHAHKKRAQSVISATKERCKRVGLRPYAERVGVHAGTLANILNGRRNASEAMLTKLETDLHDR